MLSEGVVREMTWTAALICEEAGALLCLEDELRLEFCDFEDECFAALMQTLSYSSHLQHFLLEDCEITTSQLRAVVKYLGNKEPKLESLGLIIHTAALADDAALVLEDLARAVPRHNLHISFPLEQESQGNYPAFLQSLGRGQRARRADHGGNEILQLALYTSFRSAEGMRDFYHSTSEVVLKLTELTIHLHRSENALEYIHFLECLSCLISSSVLRSLTFSSDDLAGVTDGHPFMTVLYRIVSKFLARNTTLESLHLRMHTNLVGLLVCQSIFPVLATEHGTLHTLEFPLSAEDDNEVRVNSTFFEVLPSMQGLRRIITSWHESHAAFWRRVLEDNSALLHLEWSNIFEEEENDANCPPPFSDDDNTPIVDDLADAPQRHVVDNLVLRNRLLKQTRSFCRVAHALNSVWDHYEDTLYAECQLSRGRLSKARVEASTSAVYTWVRDALTPQWESLIASDQNERVEAKCGMI